MSATQNNPTGPQRSRRTVIKAAAWTAPAVVVVTAAPALAVTGPPPTGASITTVNYDPDLRGFIINPISGPITPTTFPTGSVITLTVNGAGILSNVTVLGGAFSPSTPEPLTAGVYTIIPTVGAAQFAVYGNMNSGGTLTASANLTWTGPPAGSVNTGTTTTSPVP